MHLSLSLSPSLCIYIYIYIYTYVYIYVYTYTYTYIERDTDMITVFSPPDATIRGQVFQWVVATPVGSQTWACHGRKFDSFKDNGAVTLAVPRAKDSHLARVIPRRVLPCLRRRARAKCREVCTCVEQNTLKRRVDDTRAAHLHVHMYAYACLYVHSHAGVSCKPMV